MSLNVYRLPSKACTYPLLYPDSKPNVACLCDFCVGSDSIVLHAISLWLATVMICAKFNLACADSQIQP